MEGGRNIRLRLNYERGVQQCFRDRGVETEHLRVLMDVRQTFGGQPDLVILVIEEDSHGAALRKGEPEGEIAGKRSLLRRNARFNSRMPTP